ncbi:MAG: hypothetical protein PVJ67_01465 [Candidatus Pacearchaeota archaeon]|jgi:hypothetical protein
MDELYEMPEETIFEEGCKFYKLREAIGFIRERHGLEVAQKMRREDVLFGVVKMISNDKVYSVIDWQEKVGDFGSDCYREKISMH